MESRCEQMVDLRRARLRVVSLLTCVASLLAGTAALALSASAENPLPAATGELRPEASAAIDWLASQLTVHGGSLPGPDGTSPDWGVTADAIVAFVAAGRSTDPAAVTATDALTANAATFTTWTAGAETVRDAGATAKAVLALRSMGRSASAQGVDLEAELRSLIVTSGPQAGRFSDRVPDPSWNAANGFGQAIGVLALAETDGGVPASAVAFLLAQQCPSGGFRLAYGSDPGCTADASADSDATGLALSALLAAPDSPVVAAAMDRGTTWLLARQGPDGSFGGTGPTAAANANSTGLIAHFLHSSGSTAAADRAAAWIAASCQLTQTNSAGTPAAGDVGAIGYDPAARAAAIASGITPGASDQWRRTTSQAVLALGLAPFGSTGTDPGTPTSSTPTSSTPTSSTNSTSTTSSTSSTSSTSTSTTSTSSTTVVPGSNGGGDAPVASVAGSEASNDAGATIGTSVESSTGTTSTATTGLARTGGSPSTLVALGLVLLAAGTLIGAIAPRGRRGRV